MPSLNEGANFFFMEAFAKLETHIAELLTRLDTLKAENARLRAEAENSAAGRTALEEENRRLTAALAQEESLRNEVLRRVDNLLQKIQEHDSVE